MLTKAAQCGTVVIITNVRQAGELSAQRCARAPLLNQFCVFSARSNFEPAFPDIPLD